MYVNVCKRMLSVAAAAVATLQNMKTAEMVTDFIIFVRIHV